MNSSKKSLILAVVFIAILGVGVFVVTRKSTSETPATKPVETLDNFGPQHEVIGQSVQGREIDAYTYGKGKTKLVFIGGMHGGYEWNSVLLAYTFMDYLGKNHAFVPENLSVVIIPSINPDAVFKVVGKEGRFVASDVSQDAKLLASARFNANTVDLNRNFDCKWQPKSMWQNKIVSAGTSAFSEPETLAVKNFVMKNSPDAVVFWHSQANAVYASQCERGILPQTLELMNTYAKASGYPAIREFGAYATTGAADDWLASQNIPAVTVELSDHENIEWEKNLKGIKATLEYYGGVRDVISR